MSAKLFQLLPPQIQIRFLFSLDPPTWLSSSKTFTKFSVPNTYGEIGQNILNSTTTTLVAPGPCPHYNDPCLHPITAAPIPNSRKYEQIAMTNIEAANPNFDTNTTLPRRIQTQPGHQNLALSHRSLYSMTNSLLSSVNMFPRMPSK